MASSDLSSLRCWNMSILWGDPQLPWPRFLRACQRRPIPLGATHCGPSTFCNARSHPPWCSCAHAPYGCAQRGRGTFPTHSTLALLHPAWPQTHLHCPRLPAILLRSSLPRIATSNCSHVVLNPHTDTVMWEQGPVPIMCFYEFTLSVCPTAKIFSQLFI